MKPRLKELIIRAQNGDVEATEQLITRLMPLVRKHSRKLGYDEACSDLVIWIVEAIQRYKPNTAWGKDELEKYVSNLSNNKNNK